MNSKRDSLADSNKLSPSIPQLATITSLVQKNMRLRSQINQPISLAVSMIFLPLLFRMMITHPNSPLYPVYEAICESLFAEERNSTIQKPAVKHLFDNLALAKKLRTDIQEQIVRLATKAFKRAPIEYSIQQVLDAIEQHYSQTGASHLIKELKLDLMKLGNSFLNAIKYIPDPIISEQYYKIAFKDLSLSAAHELVEGFRKNITVFTRTVYSEKISDHITDNFYRTARMMLLFPTIFLTYLTNYLVIDPIVDLIFPQGIMQPHPPKVPQMMDRHQANDLIQKLTDHQTRLLEVVRRNENIEGYVSLALVASAIYLYFYEEPYIEFALIMFVLGNYSFLQQIMRFTDAFKHRSKVSFQLDNIHNHWKTAIEGNEIHCVDLKLTQEISVEASYFTFTFAAANKNIKAHLNYARIFKDCCLQHGINSITQQHRLVCIFANTTMTAQKALAIKQLFKDSVSKYIDIYHYLNQLQQIYLKCNNGQTLNNSRALNEDLIIDPAFDHNGLPTVTVIFTIPLVLANPIQQIKSLFPQSKIEMTADEENVRLILRGTKPATAAQLKTFLQTLTLPKTPVAEETPQASATSTEMISKKISIQAKPTGMTTTSKKDLPAAATIKSSVRATLAHSIWRAPINEWPSGKKTDPDVFSILLNNQPDSRTTRANARIFIKNQLDPRLISKNVYKAVQTHITNAKFAPPKGQQGIVRFGHNARDQYDRKFFAAYKIKLIGDHGNIRAYAASEISATGLMLLIVKGASYKSHKDEKKMAASLRR